MVCETGSLEAECEAHLPRTATNWKARRLDGAAERSGA